MIIKLPNADFSANNIGTVDLRTAISANTQAVLDVYGKTWTLQQQFAIEDFLTTFSNASWNNKVEKLVLPIFDAAKTITNALQPNAFYDIVSQTIVPAFYGPGYSEDKLINANGISDPNPTAVGSNNYMGINLGTPTSWNDVHIGAYWHKTNAVANEDVMAALDFADAGLRSSLGIIGNSNKITYNFDPNSYATRGLRIISYDGTNKTGLAANLPFASTVGSGNVDSSGDFNAVLFSRFASINDVTVGLFSFGTAMTQAEIVEYNSAINLLMDALWSE